MPVHWYYNPGDILRDFGGPIARYEAPKVGEWVNGWKGEGVVSCTHHTLRQPCAAQARHPSSILNLSNTGGAGRGGQSGALRVEVAHVGACLNPRLPLGWLCRRQHHR